MQCCKCSNITHSLIHLQKLIVESQILTRNARSVKIAPDNDAFNKIVEEMSEVDKKV